MERALDVRTAEAIAVHYELAGLGSRFLALCIDIAIQLGVVIVAFVAVAIVGAISGSHAPVLSPHETALGRSFLIATGAIAGFALFFGYFIAFDLLWNGQSPGKRALGLRVVRDGGFPIDAGASVTRNLVRVIEMSLGFYVISAAVTLLSPENKRLGDLAAGTIVVRDDAAAIPTLATIVREDALTDDGLDSSDRALIDQYLARRANLDPLAAQTIAVALAERVRPKLRASFHYLDDVALLEHLARSRG